MHTRTKLVIAVAATLLAGCVNGSLTEVEWCAAPDTVVMKTRTDTLTANICWTVEFRTTIKRKG